MPKFGAEEDLLAFGHEVVERRVVGDRVLQPRIVELELRAPAVQAEPVQMPRIGGAGDGRADDQSRRRTARRAPSR